jgi:predicted CXXCH cytochrome family protein
LASDEPDLCIDCHDDVGESLEEEGDRLSRHFPAVEGECSSCHDPHGSAVAGLLAGQYPAEPYGKFDEDRFELCFSCHDATLVSEGRTDEETEFRNGDVNLHYLHVAKNAKGRSCDLCHLSHASTQSRLVRPSVKFGEWLMPVEFKATDTGGYCGPACHSAKSYDRVTPVDWSVRPDPPK